MKIAHLFCHAKNPDVVLLDRLDSLETRLASIDSLATRLDSIDSHLAHLAERPEAQLDPNRTKTLKRWFLFLGIIFVLSLGLNQYARLKISDSIPPNFSRCNP